MSGSGDEKVILNNLICVNLYEIDFMIVMNIFVRIMCSTFFTAHQGSRKTGMRLERRCLLYLDLVC